MFVNILLADVLSIPSLIDETVVGDGGDINWEAAAILLARTSAELKEIGKSSIDSVWSIFDKVSIFVFSYSPDVLAGCVFNSVSVTLTAQQYLNVLSSSSL